MKVSKKEYKQLQNQAAAYLVNGLLWTFYFGMTGFRLFQDHQNDLEIDNFNLFFTVFWFVVGVPVSLWKWRREEKKAKDAEII